jgi:glyoxylase-like metal-dependent hydrolase (beta-lactamase superfamily II)
VLWLEDRNAVICGDTLVDFGDGFGIATWLRADVSHEQVAEGLRPLLALPVELVLPLHGAPTDRAALERAPLTGERALERRFVGRRSVCEQHDLDG